MGCLGREERRAAANATECLDLYANEGSKVQDCSVSTMDSLSQYFRVLPFIPEFHNYTVGEHLHDRITNKAHYVINKWRLRYLITGLSRLLFKDLHCILTVEVKLQMQMMGVAEIKT